MSERIESQESVEKPRGALFVIWNRADNTFLLEHRNDKSPYYPNMWNFPGETAESTDADIESTVLRGITEECGFTPERGELHSFMDGLHKQPHAPGSVKVFLIEVSDAGRVKEKPEGERENAGMKWATLAEVEELIATKQFGFGQESFLDDLKAYVAKAEAAI